MFLDEREGGLGGLLVALDRRGLAAADRIVVTDRHVHDVGPVLRLAADDERLREVEADDLGAHLHARRGYFAMDATCAATSAASWPVTIPEGITPRPLATTPATSAAVSLLPRERRTDSARRVGAVATGAAGREDRGSALCVPRPRSGDGRGHRRGERVPLGEPEDGERDRDENDERCEAARHQKPNRTFVKYQKLDVSHSVARIAATEPPRTGSTQWG